MQIAFPSLERRSVLSRLDRLPMRIILWNGRAYGPPDAEVAFRLPRPGSLRVFLRPTAGKLATAYVEGDIDIEGDLRKAIVLGAAVGAKPLGRGGSPWGFFASPFHSRDSDRGAVRFHYDVSNDFYGLWLDARRVYSCAYFRTERDTLELAQEQKLDHICRKLCLSAGDRFLDIGCGWGGLLLWAAEHYGAQCTGITLSRDQFDHATRLVRERGLESRCSVRLMDYRDLDPSEPFDKIASVGMFEHVGRKNLGIYFRKIHELLAPGGLVLNHGISASWTKGHSLGGDIAQFMDRYVFPDGELVHISEAMPELSAAGLEIHDLECLRKHYAKTLSCWVDRLEAHAARARELVGERAFRIWRIYMASCAYGFEKGWLSLYQTLAGRPLENGSLPYPLTREHLYDGLPPVPREAGGTR